MAWGIFSSKKQVAKAEKQLMTAEQIEANIQKLTSELVAIMKTGNFRDPRIKEIKGEILNLTKKNINLIRKAGT